MFLRNVGPFSTGYTVISQKTELSTTTCENLKFHLLYNATWWSAIDRFWTTDWIYWALTLVTTYRTVSLSYALKTTVTTARIKSSQSSLAIAWQRLLTTDVPLPLGSRTVPGLSYQHLTSHNCNSQLTQQLKTNVSQSYTSITTDGQLDLLYTWIENIEYYQKDIVGTTEPIKVGWVSVYNHRKYVTCLLHHRLIK
jgi:hypothetical protein